MFLYCYWEAGKSKRRHRTGCACEVIKRDILKGSADRHIDALPGPANATHSLMLAITITGAALGDGYGALERIDDVSGTDVLRAA
jgi:hypothetical protein